MKTKIIILLLSVVAFVSFTALSSKGQASGKNKEPKSYQSQGGQLMSDRNQFD